MDLTTVAESAAAAYVSGLAAHAATDTDAAAITMLNRIREFIASRWDNSIIPEGRDEADLAASILSALQNDPGSAAVLAEILNKPDSSRIGGAGTIYGDVKLKGKYVAGRDITFKK